MGAHIKTPFWRVWGDSYEQKTLLYVGHLALNWYPTGASALGLRPRSTWKSWSIDLGRLSVIWLPLTFREARARYLKIVQELNFPRQQREALAGVIRESIEDGRK